jgi:hypothetical protein
VADHVSGVEWGDLAGLKYRQFNLHAERLVNDRFLEAIKHHSMSLGRLAEVSIMAGLLARQVRHRTGERMYLRAWKWSNHLKQLRAEVKRNESQNSSLDQGPRKKKCRRKRMMAMEMFATGSS